MIALSKRASRNMKRFPACMAAGAMLLVSSPAVAAISGPATVTEGDSYSLTWSFPGTRLRLSPASGGSATSIWSGSSATFTNAQTGTYTYIEELCVALFGTQSCASVDTHTVTVNAHTPAPTPVPPPPVPTGLNVPSTNDTGRYSAMWNASPGATRYQLQERISSGGWRTVHDRPATRKSFSGKGSATYHYRVRACAASCSGWSGTDSVRLVRASGTPGPVPEPLWVPVAGSNGTTMMVAVAPLPPAPGRTQVPRVSTDGAVTVTWDAVAGATFYQVEQYSAADGRWHRVHVTSGAGWRARGLDSGAYRYRVRACNASGCGAPSGAGQALVSVPVDHVRVFPRPVHDAGVDATAASHEVGPDGSASYRIPVTVAAGKGGLQPQLSVNYNSNAGNGLMGVGWSLGGLSAIHRCAKTRVRDGVVDGVDLDGTDKYCLDGQRLVGVSGAYGAHGAGYRTEHDAFSRIRSYGSAGDGPARFRVWHKDGKVSDYGASDDSRIEAQGRRAVTIWALNRVEDAYSNYLQVRYTEDSTGGYRPSSIAYTGNVDAGVAPYYSVTFEYERRRDNIPGFLRGSEMNLPVRLSRIATRHGLTRVREYRFDYYELPVTGLSRLDTVTECVAGVCLKPTQTFYASSNNDGEYRSGNYARLASSGYGAGWRMTSGDVDGDGLVDTIAYLIGSSGGAGKIRIRPLLSNGDGTHRVGPESVSAAGGYGGSGWTMTTGDVNGDGLTDLIACFTGPGGVRGMRLVAYTSDGDGAFTEGSDHRPGATDDDFDPGIGGERGIYSAPGSSRSAARDSATGWAMTAGDANGDGRTDLIAYYIGGNDGIRVQPFMSNGDRPATFTAGRYSTPAGAGYGAGWKMVAADADGDGLTDLVAHDIGGNAGLRLRAVFSTGTGGYAGGRLVTLSAAGHGAGWRLLATDANGDGLTDMTAYHIGNATGGLRLRTLLSRGDGTYTPGIDRTIASRGYGAGWRVTAGDANGDGYGDVIAYAIGRNNGVRVLPLLSRGTGDYAAGRLNVLATSGYDSSWDMLPGDTNGDGLTEMVAFQIGQGGDGGVRLSPYLSREASPEKLTAITNGAGARVAFDYEPLTRSRAYTRGTGAVYPVVDATGPQCVVTRKTVANGLGGEFTTRYRYEGLKLHSQGLGSLGFSSMRTLNEDTGTRTDTYFSQDSVARTEGSVDRITTTAGNGTVLSDTVNDWDSVAVPGGDIMRYRRRLASTEVRKRDLNDAFLHREVTGYSYDEFDNIRVVNSVVYDAAGAAIRTTHTANGYRNDADAWLLGLLTATTVTVSAYGDRQIRQSSWTYDDVTGRKLSESVHDPSSGGRPVITTRYSDIDRFGNHRTTTVSGPDFASRTSSVAHDGSGRFVVRATNAVGHVASSTYYPDSHVNAGLLRTHTDINGQVTRHEYDVTGRTIRTIAADGSASPVTVRTGFRWCGDLEGLCPSRAVYAITRASDDGSASRVFIDGLGREVRRSSRGLDGRFAHIDSGYDAQGRNVRLSEPYFDGGRRHVMTLRYDALGRIIESTHADGSVDSVTFDGLTRTSRNDIHGAGQRKIEYRDVLGNLVRVTDNDGESIRYTYDAGGNMLTVVDPALNTTTLTYDALGRKRSMHDPDKGVWRYTYNGRGELLSQTNARNEVTCHAYDRMGRLVARVDGYRGGLPAGPGERSDAGNGCANPGAGSATARWVYDTAPGRGLGRLHTATGAADPATGSAGYQESYRYDGHGRVVAERRVIDGTAYVITTGYDALHRPEVVTYPGAGHRLQVKTTYNNAGFPVEIRNAVSDAVYHRVTGVDARGNVISEHHGNGVRTQRAYDAGTGRLASIDAYRPLDGTRPGVQSVAFDFDVTGNLIRRRDHLRNVNGQFTYDGLNRLRTATSDFGNGDLRLAAVTYDALGNIMSKTGVGSYRYGGMSCGRRAGPHAVTATTAPGATATATAYCYDANGNMTRGGGRTIAYSHFDKPVMIARDGHDTTIRYGPDRRRYQRIDRQGGTTTTYTYAGGLYERVDRTGGVTEERHFVGDSVVVTVTGRSAGRAGSTRTRYLHKDHIGSITVITDERAAIVEEFSFDAWGQRRAPGLARLEQLHNTPWNLMSALEQGNLSLAPALLASRVTNRGFTGHEQMDGVGLIHMNGRVYDARLGRFLSADPFIQDRTSSQALNRYSYVENNPLSYTDPSGYFLKKVFRKLKKLVGKVWKGIRTGLQGLFQGIGRVFNAVPGLSTVVGVVLSVVNPVAGALYFKVLAGLNAAVSLANGASIGDVATGFAVGLVTSGLGGALGDVLSKGIGVAGHYVAGGLTGGAAAKALGGRFKDGFAGGLLGAAARHVMERTNSQPSTQNTDNGSSSESSTSATAASTSNQSRILSITADVAGKIWNAPNTAIGLVFGGLGHIAGLILGTNPSVSFGNNAIQFHNNPLMGSAITLGNVIVYGPTTTPTDLNIPFSTTPKGHTVGQEEFRHTQQGQILGPLYLPAHMAGGVGSMFRSQHPKLRYPVGVWHKNNFMEIGPMQDRRF